MSRPTLPTSEMRERLNCTLQPLARGRNADAFRRALDDDPHRCLWWDFIVRADGLPCERYEAEYDAILDTIARKVAAGKVPPERPLSHCFAIIAVKTRKGRRQEFRRQCPNWVGRLWDANPVAGPPLESEHAERAWLRECESLREELATRIRPEALKLFWAVQAHASARGTAHGALLDTARGMRATAADPWTYLPLDGSRETVRVEGHTYRAVVRCYHQTKDQIVAILLAHGIAVPRRFSTVGTRAN